MDGLRPSTIYAEVQCILLFATSVDADRQRHRRGLQEQSDKHDRHADNRRQRIVRFLILNDRPAMKIDIDTLTEAELIDLNHRVVARLRLIQQMRAHKDMLEYQIGDRVSFQPAAQERVEGVLVRYNKKTVTVITSDGRQWNVSPQLLSKVVAPAHKATDRSNVILLGKG